METDWSWEPLPGGARLWVSPRHKFGADAFFLADFARPQAGGLACDLGAGCGILAALLLERADAPRQAAAVELQREAVELMGRTAAENRWEGRLTPLWGDLRDGAALAQGLPAGRFDLVICNPPYVAPGSGGASPSPARQAARHEGEESCTLAEACAAAARLLRVGGRAAFCHRPQRLCDLLEALRRAGLEPKRLRMVQQRADSAPWLVLAEGKKGGAPSLAVEAPLVLEDPDGGPSPEVRCIYGPAGRAEQSGGPSPGSRTG